MKIVSRHILIPYLKNKTNLDTGLVLVGSIIILVASFMTWFITPGITFQETYVKGISGDGRFTVACSLFIIFLIFFSKKRIGIKRFLLIGIACIFLTYIAGINIAKEYNDPLFSLGMYVRRGTGITVLLVGIFFIAIGCGREIYLRSLNLFLKFKLIDKDVQKVLISVSGIMAASICGALIAITPAILNYVERYIGPTVSVHALVDSFSDNSARHIVAFPKNEDKADSTAEPTSITSVVSASCMEISSSKGYQFKENPSKSKLFEGFIDVGIDSDKPVLIEQIKLKIENVEEKSSKDFSLNYYVPQGGRGGPVNQVNLKNFDIYPRNNSYSLLHQEYSLETNDSIDFIVPIKLYQPGYYTCSVVVECRTYNGRELDPIESKPFQLKWIYVDQLDPNKIQEPPVVHDMFGDINAKKCD